MRYKLILLAYLIALHSNAQILDVPFNQTKEEYYADMETWEYESKTFDCSISRKVIQTANIFSNVEEMDKTDFKGLIKLLESYAKYFTEKSPKFSWKYELLFFDTDIKFDFVTGNENRIIAQAHSPLEGDARIIINIDKWEELKPLERVWLFFHEYAHEVYGLEHGEIKLMYPLLPKDKLKDDFNLEDEYIVGNKDAVKSKRRNKDELLLPFLSPYCKTTALEYFRHVSKSSAYLFNAIDEFIGYISQSQYPFSKNTTLIEVEKTYPKIKSNGKVAFPEHKYVIAVPLNYKY